MQCRQFLDFSIRVLDKEAALKMSLLNPPRKVTSYWFSLLKHRRHDMLHDNFQG